MACTLGSPGSNPAATWQQRQIRIEPFAQIAAELGHELAARVRLDLQWAQSADLCLDIEGVPRGVARGATSGTRDVGRLDFWLYRSGER